MIIVDMNQVMISTFMVQIVNQGGQVAVEEPLIRHMVLNCIRSYRNKHKQYGELVIACDDTNYWRKELFPYYKYSRKVDRDNSTIDWNAMFQSLNKIRDEIKEVFPYRVIQITTAEADDVIATLCRNFEADYPGAEKNLILSGDKDFQQLQRYVNVDQYDPTHAKIIKTTDPVRFLKEHIIRGDAGDGVPNIRSDDNCFAIKKRQLPISQKKLDIWLTQEPEQFCDEVMLTRYRRNEALIDLTKIPQHISDAVMQEYKRQEDKTKDRSKLFNYFMHHKLNQHMTNIQEF